jgi:transposase
MTECYQSVKIITATERRRKWSSNQKRAIVQETYLPGMNVSIVARKYNIQPSQLFMWRKTMEQASNEALKHDEEVISKSEAILMEKRIRELERALGKKTLENEILREAVKLAQKKKLISQQPLQGIEDFH